jgi:uncharacterized membrane protein YkvA (DUF1232 family)
MANVFFELALKKAARLIGKPGRLMMLVAQLARHISRMEKKTFSVSTWKSKISLLARMIKAYALGQYRSLPMKSMLVVVAAVVYFMNPLDLIPDWIPGLGMTDDVGILAWVYQTLASEVDKFRLWETRQKFDLQTQTNDT